MCDFSELTGKTIVKINGEKGDAEIELFCSDGEKFVLFHSQDCCEHVRLYDVDGELSDVIGSPVLLAEERKNTNEDVPPDNDYSGSFTWTFYTIRTNKASITMRWLGESNGYYSEAVSVQRVAYQRETTN